MKIVRPAFTFGSTNTLILRKVKFTSFFTGIIIEAFQDFSVKYLPSNFYNISLFTVYETLLKKEFAQKYFYNINPKPD
jgi:hypothetical protein